MLKAVFFDLDGTLLPMDETTFTKVYFKLLCKKMLQFGYDDTQKMINTIWQGTMMMYKNDGKKTNEQVFWDAFCSVYGEEKRKDIPIFDAFYSDEFLATKAYTGENPLAEKIVSFCRDNLQNVVLSTNPIFPKEGQMSRLSFIGLKREDFDFVTDYSNSYFCKPNPSYFKALLERFDLKPEEVILFGNNTHEDGDCAAALGIKTYLVKGHIIYSDKTKEGVTYEEIEMNEIIPTIQKEIQLRR